MSVGIVGYGVYIPKYRLKREDIARVWGGRAPGINEKSVVGFDEDATTMAVAAAQDAISHAGVAPSEVGALYVGSVSSPYISKSMAVIIAEALGMSQSASIADFGGSTRSSTIALRSCMDFLEAGRGKYGLVIGTDWQLGVPGDSLEHSLGAGAAACLLGSGGKIAEFEDSYSLSTSFTGTWRSDGSQFVNRYDDPRYERFAGYSKIIVDTGKGFFKKTGKTGSDFQYAAFTQPDAQSPASAAKKLGIKSVKMPSSIVSPLCGDTGSSSAFLELATALDQAEPGERILLASYGSGAGSDAFSLLVSEDINAKRGKTAPVQYYLENKEYIDYYTYQKTIGLLKVKGLPEPMSAIVTQPSGEREKDYELKLKALECKGCGSLNFPKRHYCIDCRGEEFEEVPLPRRGNIITFNFQYVVAVSPEQAPIPICTAKMEGAKGQYGGNVSSMMTDCKPEDVTVGGKVELIFRRCGQELGLVRYGYKFRPVKG